MNKEFNTKKVRICNLRTGDVILNNDVPCVIIGRIIVGEEVIDNIAYLDDNLEPNMDFIQNIKTLYSHTNNTIDLVKNLKFDIKKNLVATRK